MKTYLHDEPGPWMSVITWLIGIAAIAALLVLGG
jgi:hypothetical protein